jgi:anaerobic magnesium-protoporphyrin IX monomethyl ester cyclase
MLKRHGRVILFLPKYSGRLLGPPLGLLSLAGSLRAAGYEPLIIDGALHADHVTRIQEALDSALCFGVSLLTGPMVRDAITVSRMVRRLRPDLPIIFGGWHPSLQSGDTLREDFVDVVVRHQGDKTLLEIADRLVAGNSLDMVAGCWFKRDGRIVKNPDRPASAISDLAAPAYDLANFDDYARYGGGRKLPYATSIGCPYACNYCTDTVFYNRRFNAYEVTRVVNEVTELVRRHKVDKVALVDSNFLVDLHRAVGIARGFIHSGLKLKWTFQASTDLLCRMSDEDVALLGASGVSHIGFGTESASPEVLTWMNKKHQSIPDISEAARKCSQAGIRVTLNLIFGYPGEQEAHRKVTLRVMSEIGMRFDNVTFSPNIFTPYPGIPIWPNLKERGLHEPETLEELADIDLGSSTLPWLRGEPYNTLQRSISYLVLDNELNKAWRKSGSPTIKRALSLLRKPLQWRLRNHSFDWPLELWLSMAKRWMAMRRSFLTGQPLSQTSGRSA